jgi:divalent metal cation (Fe/Co/Zn/Cd) transporter
MENKLTDVKTPDSFTEQQQTLYQTASALALITIFYNLFEGLVSIYFGLEDDTLSLFGFGIDSFVEVISGVGIWHMTQRLRQNQDASSDRFEKQALKITGTAFYLLAAGLIATAAINLYQGHSPETTFWGIVVSLVSIFTMGLLIHYKVKVGKALGSDAILADANCTKTCLYLSFALLLSSAAYELTGIGQVDSAGALFISYFALKEGQESFEKAKSGKSCSCHSCQN